MNDFKKILVIGAGAVGGYYGAKLTLAGQDVTFLTRGQTFHHLKNNLLQVKSYQGNFETSLNVIDNLEKISPPDLILMTVKCYDTDVVLEQIKPIVGPQTTLLSFQNGVENELKMKALFGEERTLGGVCYIGAEVTAPGMINHSANGKVAFGELNGKSTPRIQALEKIFSEAGVETMVSDNIWRHLWIKLGWNASFNQICTLARTDVAHVLDHPPLRSLVHKTYQEVFSVARGFNLDIDESVIEMSLAFSESDLRSVRPSMLQDFENKRRLEHETFAGFLSREGKKLNIPTPINDTFYAFLSFLSL